MRLFWPLAAACLLALLPAAVTRAEDAAPPPDHAPAEAAPAQPEEGVEDADGSEPAQPEGVKRLPPGTAEEEREYKKRKTREDPFLTAPAERSPEPFYDPARSLRPDAFPAFASYLAQDVSGKVHGTLTIDLRAEKHPTEGELLHLTEAADFSPRYKLEAWAHAGTFRPRRTVQKWLEAQQGRQADQTIADYLFDRLTLSEGLGEVSTRELRRVPPFTFDNAELLLLLRQLQFVRGDWPFEAALINLDGEVLPLSVEAPKISECVAADGVSYGCYELQITHGSEKLRAWVERASPHRLVKFERSALVYTLQDYRAYQPAPRGQV